MKEGDIIESNRLPQGTEEFQLVLREGKELLFRYNELLSSVSEVVRVLYAKFGEELPNNKNQKEPEDKMLLKKLLQGCKDGEIGKVSEILKGGNGMEMLTFRVTNFIHGKEIVDTKDVFDFLRPYSNQLDMVKFLADYVNDQLHKTVENFESSISTLKKEVEEKTSEKVNRSLEGYVPPIGGSVSSINANNTQVSGAPLALDS